MGNRLFALQDHFAMTAKDCTQPSAQNQGLVRDLNPGPLAPEARIIPLDQRATRNWFKMSISEIGQMISSGASV